MMKNKYREVIKEIIGPGAEERGFAYSCSGGMAMTKPLAMYSRKDENVTQMIYIYQNKIDPTQFVFDCGKMMQEKKYKCQTFEEFVDATKEVNRYLIEERYSEMDASLNSPYRIRIKDEERFRDCFEELSKQFEAKYPISGCDDTLQMLKFLDECYEEVYKYQEKEAREFLFELSAEYGKALLTLPHMHLLWSEDCRFMVVSEDYSVILRRNMLLKYVFSVYKNGNKPLFEKNYPNFLNSIDRKKFLEEK